ncbi:MAG: hypothetical protein M1819_007000 [Sarea resinae]|nr:MAG: hypothetical protein M1819_007000 [Sarea resinae]
MRSHYQDETRAGGLKHRLPFLNLKFSARVRVVDFFPSNLVDFALPKDDSQVAGLQTPKERETTSSSSNGWEWCFFLLIEDAEQAVSTSKGRSFMRVVVKGPEATQLVGFEPEDLHKNPFALNRFRERLFILWGDLEERKAAAAKHEPEPLRSKDSNQQVEKRKGIEKNEPTMGEVGRMNFKPSSRAFECCIYEYGVEAQDSLKAIQDGKEIPWWKGEQPIRGWQRVFRIFNTAIL